MSTHVFREAPHRPAFITPTAGSFVTQGSVDWAGRVIGLKRVGDPPILNPEAPLKSSPQPDVRRAWLLSFVAGAAALGINQFGLAVFGGTELLLGGWLVLLVVYAYGPWHGAAAAAIALSTTVYTWGHPWGLMCSVGEAIAVGWLVHRRGWSRLSAGAVYWALVGVPLVAAGILLWSDIPFPSNWAIVVKYPANSLLIMLVALPVFESPRVQRWLLPGREARPPDAPLARMLFNRFGVILGLAIAALSIVAGRSFDASLRRLAEQSLTQDVAGIARTLTAYLDAHQRPLRLTAREIEAHQANPERLSAQLDRVRAEYPGFLTMLCADRGGEIIAASPAIGGDGRPVVGSGLRVADRDYFRTPMATGQPFLSAVFRGRGFGSDLIVAMSEPVRNESGRPAWLVEGSLDLRRLLQEAGRAGGLGQRSLLILDQTRHVVTSVGVLQRPILQRLEGDALVRAAEVAGEQTFFYDHEERGQTRERFLVHRARVPGYDWEVYLGEPVWASQRLVAAFYLTTWIAAACALGFALLLAQFTSRELTEPLIRLRDYIKSLARGETGAVPGLPRVAHELDQLSAATQEAALALSRSNRELARALDQRDRTHEQLRQVLLHLDQKVSSRTAELAVALQQAESASRAKSEFIAGTSHELRTPLNAVLGLSEILLDGTLGQMTPDQADCIRGIDESGRHLLALINDILDLAKIEAGKFEIDRQPVGLRDLCEASVRLVRANAEKKHQQLTVEITAATPHLVGDPRRLKQVLVNLLGNAIKFTSDGGRIALEVSERAVPPELHFAVVDSGIGMKPEQVARLFTPFQQLDAALNRRHPGTGLGLVLARHMVEMHGGRIAVESSAGAGSRFTVALPFDPTGDSLPAAKPVAQPLRRGAPLPASVHVLLAEDNEINRLVLEQAALFSQCRITIARDGAEAVRLSLADPPDLILMDVQMPQVDGLDATRRLRADARTARTPIIIVTAQAMPEDRARCLEAGATSYLTKPIDLRLLAHEVAHALRRTTNSDS